MKTCQTGIELLKRLEGLQDGDARRPKLQPYHDVRGLPTIGYGHRLRPGLDDGLTAGITPEQAEQILAADLAEAESAVGALVRVPLNAHQFAALVIFVFNIGVEAFRKSTTLRRLNAGDYAGAAEAMKLFCKITVQRDGKATKVVSRGLVNRRAAEVELFHRPVVKPLAKSRTVTGAAVAVAATATDAVTQLTELQGFLGGLGVDASWLKLALAAVAILGAVTAIYAKLDDRLNGRLA